MSSCVLTYLLLSAFCSQIVPNRKLLHFLNQKTVILKQPVGPLKVVLFSVLKMQNIRIWDKKSDKIIIRSQKLKIKTQNGFSKIDFPFN